MKLRQLSELEVAEKPVLVRAGLNVSVKNGKIDDDFRIRSVLGTLDYLAKKNARPVILSHLGRPNGWDTEYSLAPVAYRLADIWNRKLVLIKPGADKLPQYGIPHLYFFEQNLEQENLRPLVDQLQDRDAAILENLRFYPEEKQNDQGFARRLAALGDAYVNEAFADSHRAHASIVGVARLLPAAAGLDFANEVAKLSRVLVNPKKPVVVMMGGVKLSDKGEALEHLAKTADFILLGGGLANLFLKIRGFEIGKSVYEEGSQEQMAKQLWRDYREKIILPIDVVVSDSREGAPDCVPVKEVKKSQIILDAGPQTIELYSGYLKKGRTLIWGGPIGYFENKTYSHGTFALAWLFASRSAMPSVYGIAGGGQTLEVIKKLGLGADIDHVSTGGGAMLEVLAGKTLPGVEVLQK